MRTIAIILVASLLTCSAGVGTASAQERDAWQSVAASIPLGSRVKVQTVDGKRVSGTLMRVDDRAVAVKKNGRLPEAAIVVPFESISNLERSSSNGGFGWGKAIGLGVAAGAAAIATIFVIALQLD
jgi:hypothetical protein